MLILVIAIENFYHCRNDRTCSRRRDGQSFQETLAGSLTESTYDTSNLFFARSRSSRESQSSGDVVSLGPHPYRQEAASFCPFPGAVALPKRDIEN